ncbi:MAG: DNA-binding protein WhiA [Atribacterota bacterium]|nr:DNA-binding protein WhiA [Atribacterota bacterium]
MEFRDILKSELYTFVPVAEDFLWSELAGILRAGGIIEKKRGKVVLSLRHKDLALIKKCVVLVKRFYPEVLYTITEQEKKGINSGIIYILDLGISDEQIFSKLGFGDMAPLLAMLEHSGPFFVKGVFESRGYISEPTRSYHLEISLSSEEIACALLRHLETKEMTFRLRYFREEFRLYTKSAQNIGTFLGYVGAPQSYLLLEKIRVEKLTLDDLTRWVNCATSNLERVVESSLRQRQKISHLDLEHLPPKLRQIAYLRLRYPYASLREIGELCTPPLSKMEVFRRLRKLERLGE